MLTLQALCETLETLLQVKAFSDYCPNGLQIEGASTVYKIATAVSVSEKVIEKAIDEGVQALIVHHGLFWHKEPLPLVGVKRKKIAQLMQHNISLLAYHLPLDGNQAVGNNWQAAKELGWLDLQPFLLANGQYIGVKGSFPEVTINAFQQKIEQYYDHHAQAALFGKSHVKSAALVSGGAHRSLEEAVKANVDCFITGSFDEPTWREAQEERINFFAMGHHATEVIGPRSLAHYLTTHLNVPTIYLADHNPF